MFRPQFDIFKNWNKDVYIAKKIKENIELDDYGNEIVKYEKPFYLGKLNYQPLTRKDLDAYVKEFGETNSNVVSFLLDYREDGKIDDLDLAYLYGANPKGELVNGENANYVVRAYKPQNTKIMVILERTIGG